MIFQFAFWFVVSLVFWHQGFVRPGRQDQVIFCSHPCRGFWGNDGTSFIFWIIISLSCSTVLWIVASVSLSCSKHVPFFQLIPCYARANFLKKFAIDSVDNEKDFVVDVVTVTSQDFQKFKTSMHTFIFAFWSKTWFLKFSIKRLLF
jgi:hypothetical protein